MKKIFVKDYNKNNSIIHFGFIGDEKEDNIDYKHLNKLLDTCFENYGYYGDMLRNVSWIRTIFKDFDEKHLEIQTSNDEEKNKVVFDNGELTSYDSERNLDKEQIVFKTVYNRKEGVQFQCLDSNQKILTYSVKGSVIELVSDTMNLLQDLKEGSAIKLDRADKILCEVYKLFFGENPDFSSKNIIMKMQTMVAILLEFDISLGDYSFSVYSNSKVPISDSLSCTVERLTPLGEIREIDELVKLAPTATRKIKIIGENINEYIRDEQEKVNELMRLSSIIYASRYRLSSNASTEEVAKFSECSPAEVKSSIELVKKIGKKLYD